MADNLGPMAWLFLPENVQVQYLQKIALRAENPSGPKCYYSPEGARRTQTGVLAPGDGNPHTGKPCKGDKMVFRAFSTQMLGPYITGAYTPACGLGSLSGLGLVEQIIR